VKQFVPAAMIGMLDSLSDQLPLDTFKTMGFAASNIDEEFKAVAADK